MVPELWMRLSFPVEPAGILKLGATNEVPQPGRGAFDLRSAGQVTVASSHAPDSTGRVTPHLYLAMITPDMPGALSSAPSATVVDVAAGMVWALQVRIRGSGVIAKSLCTPHPAAGSETLRAGPEKHYIDSW